MRKLNRADCPKILRDKGEKWTNNAVERGYWTNWPQHEKSKLNQILLDEGLRDQTQKHCSYCDLSPISPPGVETIDHFRPKSLFLHLAFAWDNLFYCCCHCQSKKLEIFEEALLKPDESDYTFDAYFQWNFETGELLPSDIADGDAQHRAKRTIEILQLSENHAPLRLRERCDYHNCPDKKLDEWSYRDFLEQSFES